MRAIRVLVVDDEPGIREQIATYLASRGYQTATAGSAEEALAAVEEAPADVALIDYRMPGRSGLELVADLRARHPRTALLMLTAHASVDSAVAAMKAGVLDYLQKPIEPAQLELKLRLVAEKIRAEQELEGLRHLLAALVARDWSGNVRELMHTIEAALARAKGALTPDTLPPLLGATATPTPAVAEGGPEKLSDFLDRCERAYLERTLASTGGSMREAAERLGIDERSLRRKLAKFGVDRLDFRKRS